MIIDLSNVLKVEGSKIDIDSFMKIDNIEYMGESYILSEPLKILGTIQNVIDALEFNAKVSGNLKVNCYRCLKETEHKFSFNLNEVLMNEVLMDEESSEINNEEVIRFQGNRINIKDIIVNNILLNLPMKHLCSQDCKGLCSNCGVDLNIHSCDCKNDDIDPRFEALKELFND